jgi:hypothetical protein
MFKQPARYETDTGPEGTFAYSFPRFDHFTANPSYYQILILTVFLRVL